MSGEIIQFKGKRSLARARLYREQPVPRAAFHSATVPRAGAEPVKVMMLGRYELVERHMQRIAVLLDQLKPLVEDFGGLPPDTERRARSLMARAGDVLEGWSTLNCQHEGADAGEEAADGDPQPELDNEKLERMYRSLGQEL